MSLTNSVFLSLFKISFELLDRPIAMPSNLNCIFDIVKLYLVDVLEKKF